MRLKDARSLRPRGRAIAQAVAAWREREARRTDSPVRQVLPDLAILGIAQRQPRSLDELGQARGVDDRLRRGRIAEEVFAAVKAAADADPPAYVSNGEELDRNLRPAVTLISAWVGQLAKNSKVDTTLLATRSDLVALLANDEQARLPTDGAELLGNDVQRLPDGTAGLTFTRSGGLRLVEAAPGADLPAVSRQPTDRSLCTPDPLPEDDADPPVAQVELHRCQLAEVGAPCWHISPRPCVKRVVTAASKKAVVGSLVQGRSTRVRRAWSRPRRFRRGSAPRWPRSTASISTTTATRTDYRFLASFTGTA